MEAGRKDCEEETLQTAFKKLRVDAESISGPAGVPETTAKAKFSCPKDHWHCCTRKTTRGATRSQRRRRSKSPILHPPKFTYSSTSTSAQLSPPAGCLKQQRLAVPEPLEPSPISAVEISAASALPPVLPPLSFEPCSDYDTQHTGTRSASVTSAKDVQSSTDVQSSEEGSRDPSACDGVDSGATSLWRSGAADAADFRALSELHSRSCPNGSIVSCSKKSCSSHQEKSSPDTGPPCTCKCEHNGWQGVEVYSFTGLRNVISECEKSLPSQEDGCRTLSSSAASPSSALSSGSPRSCSEQARAFVDDITIEDLSGYMEYYLYIPKKMSHMAEMMYT